MTINTSSNPYWDDFDSSKNFAQILFRPGYSVQARELTQLQSILKNQIAKFGSHVFQEGSVVLPGNSMSDLTVSYVNLVPPGFDVSTLAGKVVVDNLTGLRALVRMGTTATATDSDTIFVSYYNTGSNGNSTFTDNTSLQVEGTTTYINTALALSTGFASMAGINRGVFFVRGAFVEVLPQIVLIDKYSNTPSARVLLKIVESIVDSTADQTLLDPAQGSYNYAAPGADRLKIDLVLTTLPLSTTPNDDYIEIMRFNNGVMEEHLRYSKYNELEKNLARRTYDEAGDYVASGLKVKANENKKTAYNDGKFLNGSADLLSIDVSAGKAYIRGFEEELLEGTTFTIPKARTADHVKTVSASIFPSFAQYVLVTNLKGLPSFKNRTTVTAYGVDTAIGTGTSLGTMDVLGIDLHETNSSDQTNIWRLYVTNTSSITSMKDVGRVQSTGFTADFVTKLKVNIAGGVDFTAGENITATGTAAVVLKWNRSTTELYVTKHILATPIPTVNLKVTGGTSTATGTVITQEFIKTNALSSSVLELPYKAIKSVKNASNSVDISYVSFEELTITTTGAGPATGSNVAISGGTINPLDITNTVITSNGTGLTYALSTAALNVAGTVITLTTPTATTCNVVCAITKTGPLGSSYKSKTYVSTAQIDAGLTPTSVIQLTKADGVQLVSVVSTTDGDVTNRYIFNGGQKDYSYELSYLTLNGVNPGGTLTVTYYYFAHTGSGDYFSVDSYVSSGMPAPFYDNMYSFISPTTLKKYDLRNCLDFRPRKADGTVSGGVVANTTFTGNTIDLIQPDSRLTTSLQYYIPRIDNVVMDKNGNVYADYGIPAVQPVPNLIPQDSIPLATVYIPAYTFNIADVVVTQAKNNGYTMSAVHKLEDRIRALEDYSQLTQSENNAVNNDIIDSATGLSRYKSGYLVETFKDTSIISDFTNPDYHVSYGIGSIRPAMEKIVVPLTVSSYPGMQLTGSVTDGVLTLPYTTTPYAQQPYSTRLTNINPFNVVSWTGNIQLVPSVDNFEDTIKLADVLTTTTSYINVPRQWGYQPAPGSHVSFASNDSVWLRTWLPYAVYVHNGDTNVGDAWAVRNQSQAWWAQNMWWLP